MQITQLYVVPPVILFLAKSPLVLKYDVSSVRGVFSGAAPLSADLEREFLTRFNTEYVIQGKSASTEPLVYLIWDERTPRFLLYHNSAAPSAYKQ